MYVVPFPPSVNQYWRSVAMGRHVRVLISRRGRLYREGVLAALRVHHVTWSPLEQRLRVRVTLNPPDRRVRDLDNFAKALLDAFTHARVWNDDALIDELTIIRGPVMSPGRACVQIGIIDAPTKTDIPPADHIG